MGAFYFFFYVLFFIQLSFANTAYISKGEQVSVQLSALYESSLSIDKIKNLTQSEGSHLRKKILKTITYLYGPTTNRLFGGISKVENVEIDFQAAKLIENRVMIPYRYQAIWLLSHKALKKSELIVSVPFNEESLMTEQWKKCTDIEPIHQTQKLLWYYWDPQREGCDHQRGQHYQDVVVRTGQKLEQDEYARPQYDRLIQRQNGQKLKMTFAFGYINKDDNRGPDISQDQGMLEYQEFVKALRKNKQIQKSFQELPIHLYDYLGHENKDLIIGTKFIGTKDGVPVEIKIVTATKIDQIEIFAKSFLHDHDSTFAWFGHSRVGEGFAASQLKQIMNKNKNYYQLTTDYQILYWGGCNGYSYFTTPFFKMKSEIYPNDVDGRMNLNIISNALPSLDYLSGQNAVTFFESIFDWQKQKTFKDIVDALEVKMWNGKPALTNALF